MINWKIRIKSKKFWVTLIPAFLLLLQTVAKIFNIDLNLNMLNQHLLELVNVVFTILVILGIVVDPTTKGVGDSERALDYKEMQ